MQKAFNWWEAKDNRKQCLIFYMAKGAFSYDVRFVGRYNVLHMFRQVLFGAENQGNYQNFQKSLLTNKLWDVFMGMKQNFFFFLKKKIQNGRLKKSAFFKIANSQFFFVKISWIGPCVSRIDWCEGHQCDSTYMVVSLSDVRAKTA